MKKLIYIFILLLVFVIACKSTPKSTTPEDVVIADDPVAVEEPYPAEQEVNKEEEVVAETGNKDEKNEDEKVETVSNTKSSEEEIVVNETPKKDELYLPNDTSIRLTDRGKVLETNPKILFKFIETNIAPSASVPFAQVIEFMEKNPNVSIVIEAHTSNRGKAYPYNYNLSVERAKHGKVYLVERGIDSTRVIESPLGEALPEYPTQNALRRYEFIIIENNDDLILYNNYISKLDVRAESEYRGK